MSCGLDHKYVWHLCDGCTQRVWFCSCYIVQPSWLVMVKFSTQNDILNQITLAVQYAECPGDVSMELWGCPGRQCGPRYNKHVSAAHCTVGWATSTRKENVCILRLSTCHYQFWEITYNKQGAPISLLMNMCYWYTCWSHSCMWVMNITCRYFVLNFRCNESAGWVAGEYMTHISDRPTSLTLCPCLSSACRQAWAQWNELQGMPNRWWHGMMFLETPVPSFHPSIPFCFWFSSHSNCFISLV